LGKSPPVGLIRVTIYRVDSENMRVVSETTRVIRYADIGDTLESLKPLLRVGDMVEVEGMRLVRVKGGFRRATVEDEAVLIAGMMKE